MTCVQAAQQAGCASAQFPPAGGTYTLTTPTTATLACSPFGGAPQLSSLNNQIECVGSRWRPCLPTCGQPAQGGQLPATCVASGVGRRLQEQSEPDKAAEELKLLVEPALAE